MNIVLSSDQKAGLMREALEEARRGMQVGEVPIGCVLARYNRGTPVIVARGFNRVNLYQRRTAHAEMVAFENAGTTGVDVPAIPLDAEDVILVSTLEPCVMCLGAAMEAGVAMVLFGLPAPANGGTGRVRLTDSPEAKAPVVEGCILSEESRSLFEEWLKNPANLDQVPFVEELLART